MAVPPQAYRRKQGELPPGVSRMGPGRGEAVRARLYSGGFSWGHAGKTCTLANEYRVF